MKNINRFFAIVLFIVFSVSVWGVTSTFTSQAGAVGTGEPTWSIDGANGYEADRGIQWSATSGSLTNTSLSSNTITGISVDVSSNRGTNSISATVGGSAFGSSQTIANSNHQTKTFSGSATGDIVINISGGNKSVWVKSITVTYSSGSSYTIIAESNNTTYGTVSLTGTTITATPNSGYRIKDSGAYTVTSGTATVTRGTGSNSNKFTVTPTSNCTIRINFEALPSYTIRFFDGTTKLKEESVVSGGTASPPSNPAGCEEFTFVGWWTSSLADDNTTAHTWITDFAVTGDQDYYAVYSHPSPTSSIITLDPTTDTSFPKDGITLSVSSGTLTNGTDYRVYKGATLTISSSVGNITNIAFTFDGSYNGGGWATSYSPNSASWTSPACTSGDSGKQARITNLVVTVGSTFYTSTADCRTCSEPTLSFDVTSVNKFVGDTKFTYTATPANNPMGGTVTYSSNKPTKASVDSSTGEVTILDAMSDEPITITATLGVVDNGVNCQKKATATYTLNIYNKVTWLVNGEEHTAGSPAPTTQTTNGGQITQLPSEPNGDVVCGGKVFMGWTTSELIDPVNAAPSPLYKSVSDMSSVYINSNTTYYAVFATRTPGTGTTATYQFAITASNFSGTSYDSNNGAHSSTATDTSEPSNTMTVSWTSNNVSNSSGTQWRKSNGYIYNTTDLGKINSVTVSGDALSVYYGTSELPTGTSLGANDGYFKVANETSGALHTTSVTVNFTKSSGTADTYSDYSSVCGTCLPAPTSPTVVAKKDRATITWGAITDATGYTVTCSGGTVNVDGTTATITGLASSTNYTFSIRSQGDDPYSCFPAYNGNFTTTNCDDVPYDIIITPAVKYITVSWKAEASTATVRVYSDEECNTLVRQKTNMTSLDTINSLEENTKYYVKVFADGSCASAAVEVTTLSTAVSIAEWFPDGIKINLTADEASASVIIEDKKETSTTTSNVATGLFFSKYYEASGNIKLWAIYNGTLDKISLANVVVKTSSNGENWGYVSGSENASARVVLSAMGHKEVGWIYPGEEIIVYNDGDPSGADANVMSCMETTYGNAYRTNSDSLWYMVDNITTRVNGDDGLLLLDGTDTLDVIGGLSAHAAYLVADEYPTWGDGYGWNCDDGEDAEGNPLALSTNRCLLVRKNTVTDGLNAVAKNKTDFTTLCEEWWGAHVPKSSDAAIETQTSCDNFSYVGHYNYNNYYAHFDSITTVDELTGKKNDDGTYTIPIPLLDTLSCTMLRVKVYEGAVEKASTEYKVPIMIKTTDATTADDAYFHSYARETNSADVCRECDVVILKGATLTKASSDETKDINEVRNLTIYPGGTLIIPSGAKYEYTVNSLTMRVEGENVPFAKLKGTLNSATQQVIVTRRQDNSRPYFFSLPYDCNVSDIRWSNGETPVLGTDYRIMTYDGATRAAQGSANNGRFWTYLTETDVIHAGVGYNIQTPYQYLHELVFPMTLATTDVTAEEDDKAVITAIHQYTNSGTSINNHNWNLIAHPYISPFNPQEDGDIRYGWLDYHYDEGDNVIWERKDETHVYLTMPSFGASKVTYDQKLHSVAGVLNPFLAIFVQGAGEGDITFDKTNRILTAAPPRHLAAEAEHADESLFVGVTLTTNGKSDQTNVRLRPDFTNEYKLGYDLDKFITYYTERPQVYMVNGSRMAFRAVSDEVAANTAMPMGVYGEYAGTYTFALSEDYPIDYVEAVYLTDRETGQTTNLLCGTYSFQTSGRIYTESRFTLSVVVRREAPQTPTDIETVVSGAQQTRKILYNGQLYILQGGRVYDATGKQMLNR